MIAGIVGAWFSVKPLPMPGENPPLTEILRNLLSGSLDPVTLMFAGLILLMLTPFLRVLTAAVGFAVEKDRRFTIVSLLIFVMLLGELLYSLQ
jgi:uncharacterized membrane protein